MIAACPSRLALQQWLADGESRNGFAEHVAGCPQCQFSLDQLSDDPELRDMAAALIHADTAVANHTLAPASVFPTAIPNNIGQFQLGLELGRGGMGVVYLATDQVLNRQVAVKLLRRDSLRAGSYERLMREARSAARVHHPNVVAVYSAGVTDDGVPFLAMELIDGTSLAQAIRDKKRLSPREAASVISQIADGLAAAHAVGLVHRDVKSANILMGRESGAGDSPVPKLADFGLVHDNEANTALTADGAIAGTPAYLSPEQARGGDADPRSDIYGLGVTLYECLVGEVPFRGPPVEVLRQVLDDEPRPPRQIDATIPRDLETIVLKSLAKEPARRYQRADEFAADLRRWLNNEPILARPAGRVERSWRWCRRNPRLASLTVLVAALLFTLALGGTTAALLISEAYGRAKTDRENAVLAQRQAEADFEVALQSLYTLAETVQKQMGSQPGLLPVKRKLLETAADGLKKVIHGPTSAGRADQTVYSAHTNLGDVYKELGRTADARQEFELCLRRSEEWSRREPENVHASRAMAGALDRFGDLANEAKDAAAAMRYHKQSHEHRLRAAALEPNNPVLIRDLSISYNKIGDAELTAGNHSSSRANYEKSLELRSKPKEVADELTRLCDMRFTHNRLTDVCLFMGDVDAAETHALAAVEYGRNIAKIDAHAGRFQTVNALERLAMVTLRRFDPVAAERHRRESVAIRREIAQQDVGSANAKRQLATAISQWADTLFAKGDFDASIAAHSECIKINSDLLAADPEAVSIAINLSIAFDRVRQACCRVGRYAEAANWATQMADFYERLKGNAKFAVLKPEEAHKASKDIVATLQYAASHDLADESIFSEQPDGVRSRLQNIRIIDLALKGRTEEVLAAAAKLDTDKNAFNALMSARCCALVGQPEMVSKYLREAVRLDPAVVNDLSTYHEFYTFKDRPEFQALLPKPMPAR